MQGICGTCGCEANATPENEGYSSCCNDRITYGDEAARIKRERNCPHVHTSEGHPEIQGGYRYVEILCDDCGGYIDEEITPV